MNNILSIDIGGTFIKWAVINDYKLICNSKVPTPYNSVETFYNSIKSIIDETQEYGIKGIAISYPGTIGDNGVILQGGSLQYMNGIDLCKEIKDRFNLDAAIEKDSRCACLCEAKIGSLKGVKNGMTIVVGTGIGGAILIDGKLLNGAFHSEGEISFLFTENLFKTNMKGIIANKIGMGGFTRRIQSEFNDNELNAVNFMKMVQDGNELATSIFDDYLGEFATFIFNLQCIIDFERVVIGGGISENSFFLHALQNKYEEAFKHFPIPMKHGDIVPCKYANESNLLGAYINYCSCYTMD